MSAAPRRTGGTSVEPIEIVDDASAFVVLLDGEDRGSLWRIGPRWAVSGSRVMPASGRKRPR